MNIIGVIPARYASTRFPGKPLADICGKPMIRWVYGQVKKVKEFSDVYVATDDKRIAAVCEKFSMKYIMTSADHGTSTERVYEVAQKVAADYYVVINGDERALTVAPGIGKKIAQRVILELKDKLAKENAAVGLPVPAPAGAAGAAGPEGKLADAAAALGVLGYGPAEISAALRKLETDGMSVEDIIKAALRSMMK